MKRLIITSLIFLILLLNVISAEVIITESPKNVYNLQDTITLPIKITTLVDLNELFTVKLICNGIETEVYKKYVILSAGEESKENPYIPLIQNSMGRSTGVCKIKYSLGSLTGLTSEFRITDLIKISLKNQTTETAPGKDVAIEIEAVKENEGTVNGFLEVKTGESNSSREIKVLETVKNNYGYALFSFPKDTPAGQYLITINVYEKNQEGKITNKGLSSYNIKVTQVPTSLEIILEKSEVEPDTNVKIKTILHDQTGEKIPSSSMIIINDDKDLVREQKEYPTDEFFEFPILYKEPASVWKVKAESNNFTSEKLFKIIENPKVQTLIINKTLIITNTGNVFYNKTVVVKIGDSSVEVPVNLGIDESKKYLLSAPNGEYNIEIITEDNDSQSVENVALTGEAISVEEASKGVAKIIRHPASWIFLLLILGFFIFKIIRKGYKKSFFGKASFPLKAKPAPVVSLSPIKKGPLVSSSNRAELSLSIKGEKQSASVVCIRIKNAYDMDSKKGNAKETLQKLVNYAETKKALTYENQDNLFFIVAPVKTRTFNNERTALDIAQQAIEILSEHNKMFRQKIDFGISLNYGDIIAKQEGSSIKFMSMGTLATTAKKIASISNKEILLSEKIKERLATSTKTERKEGHGTVYYSIKEVKNPEEHQKFIKSFLNRQKRGS